MANAVTTTKQAVDAGLKVKKVMDKLTEAEKLIKTASQMQSVASPWIKVIGMLGRTYWMKDGTKTATASQEERVAAVKRCSPAAALDVQLGRVAAELSRKAYLPKVTNEALGCLEDVGPLSVIKFQEQRVEEVVDEDGKTLFTIRRPQWFLAVGHKKSLQRTGGEEDLDPTLFLVYRGTQTADDLRVDTYVGPATFGDSEEFFHSGFLSAAVNDVSLKLAFEKAKEAKEVSPETTLVVCGHSLGGAIAMTWELAGLREEYAPWHTGEVQVVSIGGPATMWAKPGPESLVELSSERAIQERMHLVRKARLQSEQTVELRSRKAKLLLVVNELDIVPRMLGSPEHIYEDLLKTVAGAVKMPVQVAAGAMAAFLGPLAATVSKSVVDQMCDAYAGQLVSQYVGIYANYTHHPEAKVLYICDGQIFEIPRTNADAWIEATQIHSYKGLAYARKYYRSIQEYHSATMYQHGLEGVWRPKQLRAIAGDVPDGTVRVMCMRHSRSYGDYVNERYLSEDPKLDHVGRWEAERESRFLKESGLLDDPEALIVVSPYRNALQTLLFLAGSSEKLKELTGAERLLVQPLAGERQHKTDWARGWSKDWLENGMARSFWNAVEGRFYAVSPEDHLNRLPDGGGAVRDDVKFKGGELDFGPLDDYCKKMGPRWAKSGAWWEHGHDRGYETRDEWLERADRLCAWLHDEAKDRKKRKVLLISHNEILIDAFYRDRDSYGTAPAEGQLERQIVDFRHVEARCFDLMHEQAGPSWDDEGKRARITRKAVVPLRTHCEVAEMLIEEALESREHPAKDFLEAADEREFDLALLQVEWARESLQSEREQPPPSHGDPTKGAANAALATATGIVASVAIAEGARELAHRGGAALGEATGPRLFAPIFEDAGKQAAKSMVGNDTAGFLLKTCDITDPRKELAGYAGAWLGKLAGEKAGAAACRELMAKLAAEVAEAIALRQAPTIARVVHKRLEN